MIYVINKGVSESLKVKAATPRKSCLAAAFTGVYYIIEGSFLLGYFTSNMLDNILYISFYLVNCYDTNLNLNLIQNLTREN